MYVIDMKKKMIAKMRLPALASFLNYAMKYEIGEFQFAATKQDAVNILFWELMSKENSYKKGIKKHEHLIGGKNV